MSTTFQSYDSALSASPAVLIQSSEVVNTASVITKATAVNYDTAIHTVSVHRVPALGSISNANVIIEQFPISPGSTIILPLGQQVLTNGESLQAYGDVALANTNINISYMVVTP